MLAAGGFAEILRERRVECMVQLVGVKAFVALHLPCPGERVIYGVLGIDIGVGDFGGGTGLSVWEKVRDERGIRVASPEVHRMEVKFLKLVGDIPRLQVTEASVQGKEELLLLLVAPLPERFWHCE